MINPVSEVGAAQVFRFSLSLGQPEMFALRDAMHTDPTGRRLLEQRPDLGVALADMNHLASLPEGSFGRHFHQFMSHPDTVPGYLLAGLAYEGGWFEALPWDDDLKWMLERIFNTHDAGHVISGYGADLAGEMLNNFFTLGTLLPDASFRVASLLPFGAIPHLVTPPIPRSRWRAHLREAFGRGQAVARHQPFSCIAWEELLPLPLEQARQQIGVPPLRDPEMRSENWGTTWLMRRFETGHGSSDAEKQRLAGYRAAVEAGVPVRKLMGCPMATRLRIGEQALAGAPHAQLMQLTERARSPRAAA
jgi:ubiquinone biosynthesis protein COQ4